MQVCSTRDARVRLSFSDSLLAGLPPGGGLYHPCPPTLTTVIARLPDDAIFVDLAAAMTKALMADERAAFGAANADAAGSGGTGGAARASTAAGAPGAANGKRPPGRASSRSADRATRTGGS